MTPLSERDWEWVNAWADGELTGPEADEFAERLKTEPALRDALESVRQVTTALSDLRPAPGRSNEDEAANVSHRPRFWTAGKALSALAASIAIVAALTLTGSPPTALSVHQAYVAQNFSPPAQPDMRPVAGAVVDGFPLLRDANLYLVATDVRENRASAHFAGVKGCRLTVLRGDFARPELSANIQMHQWIAENALFQVIATGMDSGKFEATATYLEQATQNRLQETTIMALRKAVQSSTTCRRALS